MSAVGDPNLEAIRQALADRDWATAEALLPPLEDSSGPELERLHHELDVGVTITDKYSAAWKSFVQGSHGETLRLLSEISILNPRFVDRDNLRAKAAEALTIERRDHLVAEAERRVEAARQRSDWKAVQPVVTDLREQLNAEHLMLDTPQKELVERWQKEATLKLQPPPTGRVQAPQGGPQPSRPQARARPSSARRPSSRGSPTAGLLIAAVFSIGIAALVLGVLRGGQEGFATESEATSDAAGPEPATEEGNGREPAAEPTGDDPAPERLIARLEESWRNDRNDVIAELRDGGFGLDEDGVLTGPGGFVFDTSTCPSDWDNTEGIEDGVVRIAHVAALSGTLAAYRLFGDGMIAYFEQVNSNGGIGPDGLQVELVPHDDGYVASQTVDVVDGLLAERQSFAVNTLGTPGSLAVYDTLNEACVPHPMVISSHSAWGDVNNRPWTTGLTMSFNTEAWLWGDWIERNVPAPVTVVGIVMDNDFGLSYEQSFEQFVEASEQIETVSFLRHDPAETSFTDLIEVAISRDPHVLIAMTAGVPCTRIMVDAAEAGLTETTAGMFLTAGCSQIGSYVAPAGAAAEGWRIVRGGVKSTVDPAYDNDPYISYVRESLDAAGLDPEIAILGDGFGLRAWSLHQLLEVAANLDGGLTRANLLLAQRSLSMTHPMLLEGISFGVSGAGDAYFIEGSDVSRYDTATESWIIEDVLDLNSATPSCQWVDGVGCTP